MLTTPRETGQVLRSLREDAQMTGAQLADRAGVSRRWLVAFENGKPSVDMAKVLDCFQVLGYGFTTVPLPTSTK